MARRHRSSRREKIDITDDDVNLNVEGAATPVIVQGLADITMMTLTVATLSPIIQMMSAIATTSGSALRSSAISMTNAETLALTTLSESVKSLLAEPKPVIKFPNPPPPPTAEPLAVS